MKKYIKIILIILCILPYFNLKSEIKNISNTFHICEYPFVLPFNNKVMIVWSEKDSSFFNLYYIIYSNGKWNNKKRIYSTSFHSEFPQLAIDSNGNIHLVWMEGTARANREIFHAYYSNNNWHGKEKVFTSKWNSCWPRLGVKSNNILSVIWSHEIYQYNNSKYNIHNTWKNSSWNSNGADVSHTPDTTSIHPALYVRNNTSYACWMDGTECNWHIKFSQANGQSWESPIEVAPQTGGWWPGIAVDSKNNVHILFATIKRSPYYVKRIDGIWSTPIPLPGVNNFKRDFVFIDVDNNDILHGAWRQLNNSNNNIVYASADSNGNWTTTKFVSNGINCRSPVIKADNMGYVHIVWSDEEINHGDVFYTRIKSGTGGSSESPVAIFSFIPSSGAPPLEINFNASESYDPDGEIISYIWDFGDGFTGENKTTTHTYTQKGNYTVTLTVTDNNNLNGTCKSEVHVSKPPVAKFKLDRNKGVAPLTINFDASESYDPDGKITKYLWEFGDNSTGSGKTISHTYTEPGYYAVFLTVYDNYSISSTTSNLIEVYSVHNPINIKVESKLNRNLFFKEYLNIITWDPNPYNAEHGIEIVKYNIYRKIKGQAIFEYRNTVVSNTFVFLDRGLNEINKDTFDYTITAVDSEGHESYINTFSSPSVEKIIYKKILD